MKKKIIGITVGTTMNPDKFGGSDVDLSDYAKKEDLNLKADLVDGKIPIEQLPDGIVSDSFTPDAPVPDVPVSVDITKVVATAELEEDTFNGNSLCLTKIEPSITEIIHQVSQGVDVEIHCKVTNSYLIGEVVLNLEAFNSATARFSKVTGLFENENGFNAYSVIYFEISSSEGLEISTAGRTFLSLSGDSNVGSGGDSSGGSNVSNTMRVAFDFDLATMQASNPSHTSTEIKDAYESGTIIQAVFSFVEPSLGVPALVVAPLTMLTRISDYGDIAMFNTTIEIGGTMTHIAVQIHPLGVFTRVNPLATLS